MRQVSKENERGLSRLVSLGYQNQISPSHFHVFCKYVIIVTFEISNIEELDSATARTGKIHLRHQTRCRQTTMYYSLANPDLAGLFPYPVANVYMMIVMSK